MQIKRPTYYRTRGRLMKIHLLMKKEEIDSNKIDDTKICIVLDILMATTSITSALAHGAQSIIPVLNESEALNEMEKHHPDDVCLTGEHGGIVLENFINPAPLTLCNHVEGKKVILSTTNGTVAIRKSEAAKATYAASLLNGRAVVKEVANKYEGETILVICSGSADQFCLEDFYGAGYIIREFMKLIDEDKLELSDSARSAALFYSSFIDRGEEILRQSKVGKMLHQAGFGGDVSYASEKEQFDIVPLLKGNKIVT